LLLRSAEIQPPFLRFVTLFLGGEWSRVGGAGGGAPQLQSCGASGGAGPKWWKAWQPLINVKGGAQLCPPIAGLAFTYIIYIYIYIYLLIYKYACMLIYILDDIYI